MSEYLLQMTRDTLQNWRSEFQLMWQVGGLAFLDYAGSPQSRGDDERMGPRSMCSCRSLILTVRSA